MATKYYLIPKELYNGLTKSEPENTNLEYEKKQVEKTKKSKTKDVKNILYNQEIKRYNKLKKEQDNKPVRVELTNGAKLITKPPLLRFSNQSYLLNNNDNEFGDDEPTLVDSSFEYQSAAEQTPTSSHTPINFFKN
jgi:hypothetical protein